MKKNDKTFIYCMSIFTAALLLCAAACLAIGIITEYYPTMGHFAHNAIFAPISYIVMALGPCVGILAWVRFIKKSAPDKSLPKSLFTTTMQFVNVALILYFIVNDVIDTLSYTPTAAEPSRMVVLDYVSWAFGLIAVVYLIFSAIEKDSQKPYLSALSFALPLFYAVRVLVEYFDQTVAVNSEIKVLTELALVCLLIFTTAETGLSLGRSTIFPRYMFSVVCAVAVAGGVGFGGVLSAFFSEKDYSIDTSVMFILASGALYAASRLVSSSKIEIIDRVKKEKKKPEARAEAEDKVLVEDTPEDTTEE